MALTVVPEWEAEEAGMEIRALLHERAALAVELGYWSTLLTKAVRLDRHDMTQHAAGRLAYLSTQLTRQSNQGGSAA